MKAVALFDKVAYVDADGNFASARKGEEFDLDQDQFDRKVDEGAVAKPGSKAAKELSGGVPDDADDAGDAAGEELTTPGGEPVDEPSTSRKKNG